MKTKLNIFLILGFFTLCSVAQTDIDLELESKKKKDFALAINGSALGVGAEIGMSLNEQFSLRLRGNYLNLENAMTGEEEVIGGEDFLVDAGPKSTQFDLSIEYLPFRSSSFKLVGGLGYFIEGDLSVRSNNVSGYSYKEMQIQAEDVGSVIFNIDYSGIAPYLGFGFGRAIPRKRVGVGFEIGTFYLGEPEGSILATELLAENTVVNLDKFQQDISDYRWYPFLNFRIAVNLTK
ncbi:hypothetical protein [Neptunitalea lumnitzerae]|uniref:Outer membrane protein beta-barrel domain-containing protein n=1 Tax=Neptunitalea lumnitzerae TaxID=2965509 RepID=A0ABQ5MN47_9FLAO|nr:hypothetical protein [Neptunitalea sp. Y10]GLB50741.1 hypothetical protein Y10_31090 [Neptunitalea sp. Y10]